jgi:hypothetical protein
MHALANALYPRKSLITWRCLCTAPQISSNAYFGVKLFEHMFIYSDVFCGLLFVAAIDSLYYYYYYYYYYYFDKRQLML